MVWLEDRLIKGYTFLPGWTSGDDFPHWIEISEQLYAQMLGLGD